MREASRSFQLLGSLDTELYTAVSAIREIVSKLVYHQIKKTKEWSACTGQHGNRKLMRVQGYCESQVPSHPLVNEQES